MRKKFDNSSTLVDSIIQGIQDKKGKEIVRLNLSSLENSVCEYFVICHGESNTQVEAIANSIEEKVSDKLNQRVWRRSGRENLQWVLLDYFDVVVHIFQKQYREFYRLEDLWADADCQLVESEF